MLLAFASSCIYEHCFIPSSSPTFHSAAAFAWLGFALYSLLIFSLVFSLHGMAMEFKQLTQAETVSAASGAWTRVKTEIKCVYCKTVTYAYLSVLVERGAHFHSSRIKTKAH